MTLLVDPNTQTAFANIDWQKYVQTRPPYPPSLRDLILSYRRTHATSGAERLVDLGGGVGVSTSLFAGDFDIVHLTDPSPHNVAQARMLLPQWMEQHALHTRVETSQCTAEDARETVPGSSADLVICAMAAHFVDPDALVASCAHILRPGGTLAIYSYFLPVFLQQSQHLNDTYRKVLAGFIGMVMQEGSQAYELLGTATGRVISGDGILDSLPVPAELYENAQRIRINTPPFDTFKPFTSNLPDLIEPAPPRVTPNETKFFYNTDKDKQAEGWSFPVDKAWLRAFIETMLPPTVTLSNDRYKALNDEWDAAFDAECPSGSVVAYWPFYVVLATRR